MGDYAPDKPAPPGYKYNLQGQLVHMIYDDRGHTELGMKGTIIPSAETIGDVGGNVAFDPHSMDIPQNIIECTDEGMKVIARLTRADMVAQQALPEQPASEVPAEAPFQEQAPGQLMGGAPGHLPINLSNRGGDMAKKRAKKKKKTKKTFRRGGKSAEPVSETAAAVPVTFAGIFGQYVQQFSAVFRDGGVVVLATDHQQISTYNPLPQLTNGDPIPLQLGWGGQNIQCLWAGLKFTLPDGTITFEILFVNEAPEQAATVDFP